MRSLVSPALIFFLAGFVHDAGAADPDSAWRSTLERAAAAQQAVVVYFRPEPCAGRLARKNPCVEFERHTLEHPTIQRRLGAVAFVTMPPTEGAAAAHWGKTTAGIGVFDPRGVLRARWEELPDATAFATMLDAAAAAGGELARAEAVAAEGRPQRGEIHLALALTHLGEREEARRILAGVASSPELETRQLAVIADAMVLMIEGKELEARDPLARVAREAASPLVAAQAWNTLALLEARSGNRDEARRAALAARDAAPAGPQRERAEAMLAALGGSAALAPIEIVPLQGAIRGRQRIAVRVNSSAVARVSFALDGKPIATVDQAPFATSAEFGRLPQRRTVTAVALDGNGTTLGTASLVVNDLAESFSVRIVSPSAEAATGTVAFRAEVRTPEGAGTPHHRITWNRATLFAGNALPSTVSIPDEAGILEIVVELPDGRRTEDAIVLNAPGGTLRTEVHVLELPITAKRKESFVSLTAGDLDIREEGVFVTPLSVSGGTELPLTLGILIDASSSMWEMLPDVQEAAIRFLRSALGENDRAFVIAFGEQAHLVQPATADRQALERAILSIRPNGRTALFDALAVGVLQIEGIRGRRALVAFSDGEDNTSRYERREVVELTRRLGVPIYIIAGDPPINRTTLRTTVVGPINSGTYITTLRAWNRDLNAIATAAGGRVYRLGRDGLLDAPFAEIAEAVRAQQIIALQVEGAKREHEWRALRIQPRARGVELHGPEGYYAPR